MKLEYRIIDKMLNDGVLKVKDFRKILESKMYQVDMLYFSVFGARIPKYIVVFAEYYGNYYREDLREYLDSETIDAKTILDIYQVWQGFSILKYQTKIEKGTVDDIYRFIRILERDYPLDSVKNLISYLLETYPKVKEKYNYILFIETLETKDLKEFIDVLVKNGLLEYFSKYKDIESFKDLKDISYLLRVLDDNVINLIKERLRNKILNFLNNASVSETMLRDIEMINKEMGLESFLLAFSKLQVVLPLKKKILKCLAEYLFKSGELLEENYDLLTRVVDEDIVSNPSLNVPVEAIDVPAKVYRKLYKTIDNNE